MMLSLASLLLASSEEDDALSRNKMLPMSVYHDLDKSHRDSEAYARVEKWIRDGGGVNLEEPFQGGTMLHTAAARGNKEMTSLLLEHKADPNIHSRNGATPLILATGKGHLPVVKALVEASADPDYRDDRGISALMYARIHAPTQADGRNVPSKRAARHLGSSSLRRYAESEEKRIKRQHTGALKGEHAIAKALRDANTVLRAKEKKEAAEKKKEEL